MKVVVTGGLGHIGSYLIRWLRDYEITVIDDLSTQRYCSLFDLDLPRQIRFINCSFETVDRGVYEDADFVIHLAAKTDAVHSSVEQIEDTNVSKTLRLIDVLREYSRPVLVFPSSTSIYGVAASVVHEDDRRFCNPQSPYAAAKLFIEDHLATTFPRSRYVVLRLGTIFGRSPGMRFHTVINRFCYQAAMNEPLTVWRQNYEQVRPYLGIHDAMQAISLVLSRPRMYGSTFNVLTGNYSLQSIVETIQSIRPAKMEFVDTPLLNQFSYQVSDEKIRSFGFSPSSSLTNEIAKTIAMFRGITS